MEKQVDYVIETQFGPVQLLAPDDMTACVKAKEWLTRTGTEGYNVFRYPQHWVDRDTAGLIWVPLFNFLGKTA